MKVLRNILNLPHWGFMSPFEVRGESYEFSKVEPDSVTPLIVLGILFGLES